MMNTTNMKCPNCGGKDFEDYDIGYSECTEGCFVSSVDAYVCTKCNRVELYAKQEVLDRRLAQARKQKEIEEERARMDAQIADREKELARLKSIIDDENQTVKAVREAKERIVKVEKEIRDLRSQRSNIGYYPGGFNIWRSVSSSIE